MQHPYKRLTSTHKMRPFDCGDADLNEFCMKDSYDYLRELLAVTYYVESSTETVLFFSLSNDKISSIETSNSFWRKVKKLFPFAKHRHDYPAVKIGRFAVHKKYQKSGNHWGTVTLTYIKHWMLDENKTGCRFLTVDAYRDAVPFYLRNGFVFMGNQEKENYEKGKRDTIALMYDLKSSLPTR